MTRFFNLSGMETVKVGMLAQAPQGDGGYRVYENLTFTVIEMDDRRIERVHILVTSPAAEASAEIPESENSRES